MIEWVHPGLLLILGAALIPFLKGKVKEGYLVALPAAAFLLVVFLDPGRYGVFNFLGNELVMGRVDKMSLVFSYIFTLMATIGMVYALHVKNDLEHIAALTYAGSALGVVFSGDLFTLFLFWEIMAFASVMLVWARGKEGEAPGFRYLLVHVFGGVALLAGIVIHATETKSLLFDALPHGGWGGSLILLGFLVNAAAPPLHAWLPDAYPEATVTGTVFLSAFTTKTAVYVLARGYAGMELLMWLGAFMALYGVGYAMIENNIRRLLAYHIVSQVGFMVAGIGIGTQLAINGAVAHAFAHILYKALLMMGMGSVIFMTGKRKATELGGLYKTMPITFVLFMIGGFSISGVPLMSGFISKSMTISAAGEAHRIAIYIMLTLASCGTFISTTLKLPYAVFLGEDKKIPAKDPPINMIWGMGLAAFFCILLGVWPTLLYQLLPNAVEYHPFTLEHLFGSFQLLAATGLVFLLFLKKLHPEPTISLDTDIVYRMGAREFMWAANNPISAWEAFITEAYNNVIIQPMKRFVAACRRFDVGVIDGAVNGIGRGVFGGSGISNKIENYVVYGFINMVGYSNHVLARIFRKLQTGSVHNYAMILIVGIFFLVNIYWMFKDQIKGLMMVMLQ
ncbi:MAG: Na(+)/H(+) antiporter subunit D [Candidatus Manganitrophus sp. SA1]|nr:Na(+)/H(+) antiporter subunit D [Candidatus Manganitrophus morganii]